MNEISFTVTGLPTAKSEARSMLAARHPHAGRVLCLLEAARDAVVPSAQSPFGDKQVGLDVVIEAPTDPPSDATNYLGGIADVLEDKSHRGAVDHLGELASVTLYDNDSQIQEVHYRSQHGPESQYRVRIWALSRREESAPRS